MIRGHVSPRVSHYESLCMRKMCQSFCLWSIITLVREFNANSWTLVILKFHRWTRNFIKSSFNVKVKSGPRWRASLSLWFYMCLSDEMTLFIMDPSLITEFLDDENTWSISNLYPVPCDSIPFNICYLCIFSCISEDIIKFKRFDFTFLDEWRF